MCGVWGRRKSGCPDSPFRHLASELKNGVWWSGTNRLGSLYILFQFSCLENEAYCKSCCFMFDDWTCWTTSKIFRESKWKGIVTPYKETSYNTFLRCFVPWLVVHLVDKYKQQHGQCTLWKRLFSHVRELAFWTVCSIVFRSRMLPAMGQRVVRQCTRLGLHCSLVWWPWTKPGTK